MISFKLFASVQSVFIQLFNIGQFQDILSIPQQSVVFDQGLEYVGVVGDEASEDYQALSIEEEAI
jgi:hypothetical protein